MIIVDTAKPLFPWENDTRRQVATMYMYVECIQGEPSGRFKPPAVIDLKVAF